MKKLLLGMTLVASMSAIAGSAKIEHSTCAVEKFHLINETLELNEITETLINKGYKIDVNSTTARINNSQTHFVDPIFLDENIDGLTIVVGATEQGPMQMQRQGRTMYESGGLVQLWADVEYFFTNLKYKAIETVDAIASYGHTKSVYVFDDSDETASVYSESKKTRNRLDDRAEEELASREALDMLPVCEIK